MEETRREMLLDEIQEHEREIRRLSSEIWWLDEVESCWPRAGATRESLQREVQFATAQITKRRILLALLSSRLAHEAAARP